MEESFNALLNLLQLMLVSFSVLFVLVTGALTVFGLRTINDFKKSIRSEVDSQLSIILDESNTESVGLRGDIDKIKIELSEKRKAVDALSGEIKSISHDLGIMDEGKGDAVGAFLRLSKATDSDDFDYSSSENRRSAELVFARLLNSTESEKPTGNHLYNAAATASQFQMYTTAAALAERAYSDAGTLPYQARMLRFQARAREITHTEALENAFGLVRGSDRGSIHLIVSEAFNIALYADIMDEFIRGCLSIRQENSSYTMISYMYVIEAHARLYVGRQEDIEEAGRLIERSLDILQSESPISPWYGHTVRDSANLYQRISQNSGGNPALLQSFSRHPMLEGQ